MPDSIKPKPLTAEFSVDRPINSASEDLLGRRPFAEAIAAAISSWRDEQSLVVALYGPWGCGKSSIKNMVVEVIEGLPQDRRLTVLPFNAWNFSGQEGLIEAFFRETAGVLEIKDKSKEGKRTAAQWRSISIFFRVVGSASAAAKPFIEALLYAAAPLTLGTIAWTTVGWTFGLITSIGAFTLAFACSKYLGDLSAHISDWLQARAELQQSTLDDKRRELASSLRKRATPLLVVIDDIDRLTATEIQLIFRLVKANLDLPNVAYLLLFQRDIVERALEQLSPISGRDFLEKVVLAGFDVPAIEQGQLEKVLADGINKILESSKVSVPFSHERWVDVFVPGIRHYFKTLRNVYRFLSSLRFHLSLLTAEGSFEVDIVDLIALETLRLFEPDVYRGAQIAKNELTGRISPDRLSGTDKTAENHVRKTVEHLVEVATSEHKEHVKEIIEQLFPPTAWVFNSFAFGSNYQQEWFRDRRICSFDVFDRYFLLRIPDRDISHTEIKTVLNNAGNRERLVTTLRMFLDQGRLTTLLNRLDAYKEEIDIAVAEQFITGLLDVGDELPETPPDFLEISPADYASRVIYWYLRQEKDAAKRAQVLRSSIEKSNGLFLPTLVVGREENRKQSEDRLVGDTDLDVLKSLCLRKIQECAANNTLGEKSRLIGILYSWQHWGDESESKAWVEKFIRSGGVVTFLKAALHQTTSLTVNHYAQKITEKIPMHYIEDFVAADTVDEAVKSVNLSQLDERGLKAISEWQETLQRKKFGEHDN